MTKKLEDCPFISVVLPCNRIDPYFTDAVNSILTQSFDDFELIIIMNGMTDYDIKDIIPFLESDKRIKLLITNIKGLVFSLNLGISFARGKYIARMDADDISHRDRFIKQIEFLENNSEYDVIGCRIQLIDEHGENLEKKFPFYETSQEITNILPIRNVLCHPALMFRKSSLLDVGGYKFGFMSEDHELFLRMIHKGMKFANLDDNLFYYRRHDGQITSFDNAWKNFYEISSFLFMCSFRDKQFKCLLGIIVVFPPLRKIINFIRRLRS
ncbi:glycosyltransferase [Buttiauxella gaviniae ATCC 51604]|uniref:Glycosyltransferase n=1 Tax=Buttiauxella gaviniae ATCC 51604 TaxID=1354253 RepID=A0A1B7I4Y0_9ENTR|nr:glycosyltransferase [Buttiauxella gaviniae]OAT23449.1 glycosyltransferase [Buttiauxella gaviniae ATCC 51604]